jgi:hypothetical protein
MKVEINTELLKKYIEINCYKHLEELTNFEKLTEKEINSLLEYFFDIEIQDSPYSILKHIE